jgi:hypothetical protein
MKNRYIIGVFLFVKKIYMVYAIYTFTFTLKTTVNY